MEWNEILELGKKIPETSIQQRVIKEHWKQIVIMITRNVAMDKIADWLTETSGIKVSERTLWRTLSRLKITTKDIKEAYELHQKKIEKKKIERTEKTLAPPSSWEEFKKLDIVNEFKKYCLTRRRIKESVVIDYLSIIYRACKELMVHPRHLDKEKIEKYIDDLIMSLGELIREEPYEQAVSKIITAFRVWAEFRGFTIAHKTTEYTGIWNVYFDLETRRKLVELAKQIFDKETAQMIIDVMEFYFKTGCRAKAITTIHNYICHDNVCDFYVKEKGKKKVYVWKKKIDRDLFERILRYNITEKKLKRIRTLLTKLYAKLFGLSKEDVEKIKKATLFGVRHHKYRHAKTNKIVEKDIETPLASSVIKELEERYGGKARLIYYAIRHPLHIWRHTFAIEMLEHTGYNYEVVSVLGGWVKVNTLERIYGKLEYDRAFELAFGKFKPKPFRFI